MLHVCAIKYNGGVEPQFRSESELILLILDAAIIIATTSFANIWPGNPPTIFEQSLNLS